MRDSFIVFFRRLLVLTSFALALNFQPAPAQESGSGPLFYTGNYTTDFARYYAPYALQAAGAYLPVSSLDSARGAGEDVKLVVGYAIKEPDPVVKADLIGKATNYLRAWRYQFGSEKYLPCLKNDPDCARWKYKPAVGPAFHVWARAGYPDRTVCSEVSIAFRGTDDRTWARYRTDWLSNADSVLGWATDNSYRQLARNIDTILKKIEGLPCYKIENRPQIVSVGHSLGAGLGQLAALANDPENKRLGLGITKVFAFDASPLTGSSYAPEAVRIENANVEVDLVYQSGEALAYLRGDATSPCMRTMRFDALRKAGPKKLHNMAALSREIVRMSYSQRTGDQQAFYPPPALSNCKGYVAPATDVDPTPDVAPQSPLMSGPGAPAARVSSANRGGAAMNSFAMSRGFGFETAPVTEMVGSVGEVTAKKMVGKRGVKPQAPAVQVAFDAGWPPG